MRLNKNSIQKTIKCIPIDEKLLNNLVIPKIFSQFSAINEIPILIVIEPSYLFITILVLVILLRIFNLSHLLEQKILYLC